MAEPVRERGEKNIQGWQTIPQTPRSVKKEGRKFFRCQSWDIPAAHGGAEGKQAVPLQPMEDDGEADIPTAACGGSRAVADGYSMKEGAAQWRDLTRAGSWIELQPLERSSCRSRECEEGVTERNCHELTITPILHPPCAAQDGARSESYGGRSDVKRDNKGWREFFFVSHHPYLF